MALREKRIRAFFSDDFPSMVTLTDCPDFWRERFSNGGLITVTCCPTKGADKRTRHTQGGDLYDKSLQPTCYPYDYSTVNENGQLLDGSSRRRVARHGLNFRVRLLMSRDSHMPSDPNLAPEESLARSHGLLTVRMHRGRTDHGGSVSSAGPGWRPAARRYASAHDSRSFLNPRCFRT